MKYSAHLLFSILALVIFALPTEVVFGATNPIDDFCASTVAQADSDARKQCEDLKSLQGSNTKIKSEKDSIEKEVKAIDNQIQIALQKIKVQTTIISKLSGDISVKSKTVDDLQARISTNLESLTSLLQKVNNKDSFSIVEIFFGDKHFSDFYTEVDAYSIINREITSLVNDVKTSKSETEMEKQGLEDRKDKETDAKVAVEEQKRLIDRKKAEKNTLLKLKTSEYGVAQKLLTNQQAKVAQIRSRLFKFQDGEGIPFGDAYDFAAKTSKITGVRPAFILAILTQESSYDSEDSTFGKNVGSCLLTDLSTGNGVGKNSGRFFERLMYSDTSTKRPSDTVPFEKLTGRLGRDWRTTAVSCPSDPYKDGKYYLGRGFGGGMGPSQFIPSTWELYKKRIGSVVGIDQDNVDPWNPEHAISASSIYLSDLGASLQTYTAEKNAACKYYSGSKCPSGKIYPVKGVCPKNRVCYTKREQDIIAYGTNVADRTIRLQDDVDQILGK